MGARESKCAVETPKAESRCQPISNKHLHTAMDPRSPTDGINRTPIQVNDVKGQRVGLAETLGLEDDPRSPTLGVSRTPMKDITAGTVTSFVRRLNELFVDDGEEDVKKQEGEETGAHSESKPLPSASVSDLGFEPSVYGQSDPSVTLALLPPASEQNALPPQPHTSTTEQQSEGSDPISQADSLLAASGGAGLVEAPHNTPRIREVDTVATASTSAELGGMSETAEDSVSWPAVVQYDTISDSTQIHQLPLPASQTCDLGLSDCPTTPPHTAPCGESLEVEVASLLTNEGSTSQSGPISPACPDPQAPASSGSPVQTASSSPVLKRSQTAADPQTVVSPFLQPQWLRSGLEWGVPGRGRGGKQAAPTPSLSGECPTPERRVSSRAGARPAGSRVKGQSAPGKKERCSKVLLKEGRSPLQILKETNSPRDRQMDRHLVIKKQLPLLAALDRQADRHSQAGTMGKENHLR
ncbi:CDCA3 protein, partial [Amia calva]|nr:CDCA3 protein [Amia calva]